MTEAAVDGDEVVGGDPLVVEQLLDDRDMIELAEVCSQVECQPGPRSDDDAVVAGAAVHGPDHRRLAKADAGIVRQSDAMEHGEMECRLGVASGVAQRDAGGRTGDEPATMGRREHGAALLDGDGAVAATKTPFADAAQQAGVDERRRGGAGAVLAEHLRW